MNDCVFCAIARGDEPADVAMRWVTAVAIRPRNPVVEGHLLVIPRKHAVDFAAWPWLTAEVASCAALLVQELGIGDANLIASRGPAATQTIPHLHLHIVPRHPGDGLLLPWSPR